MSLPNISGNYVYRSLVNSTFIGEDFLKLRFGEGLMTITQQDGGKFTGDFDMGSGYLMKLAGVITEAGDIFLLRMTGNGVIGTPTEGWIYDYQGTINPSWPNGINQLSTITGSVIRTVDHGNAKAGYTATFYMVYRD